MEQENKLQESISDSIAESLVYQMNLEFYSAFLYLALSSKYDVENLGNISTYFKNAYEEELEHAHKFRQFMLDNNWHISFSFTDAEDEALTSYGYDGMNLGEVLQYVLEHEQTISNSIKEIFQQAKQTGIDPETEQFLLQFIEEQVEEENEAEELLDLYLTINNEYDFNRDILTITGDEG